MTHADLTVWADATEEAKSQPAHACGWKNRATPALLLQFLLKVIVFLGVTERDSLKSLIQTCVVL